MQKNQPRKKLLTQLAWLSLFNLLVTYCIAIRYLFYLPVIESGIIHTQGKIILSIFVLFTFLGHFMVLILLPTLILILLVLIYPKHWFFNLISIILFTLFLFFILLDSGVYALYRFHLNGIIFQMIFGGAFKQIFDFSLLEYIIAVSIIIVFIFTQIFLLWLSRYICFKKRFTLGLPISMVIAAFFSYYLGLMILVFSGGEAINRFLLNYTRIYPFYSDIIGGLLFEQYGKITFDRIGEIYISQPEQINKPLNYPIHPLVCQTKKKPLNLVIIVVDTWRDDVFNAKVTPNIFQFAKKGLIFSNHLSGGNATRGGIFSIFYGLPSTYWTSFKMQGVRPVLINEILRQNYQMGIFSSSKLILPAFHKTVFNNLIKNPEKQTPGTTPYERDTTITQQFKKFIANLNPNRPFFSFLFYDTAHKFCSDPGPYQPFQPAINNCLRLDLSSKTDPLIYFNRYRNALFGIDKHIAQVINTLKTHNKLNNTVVIITSDHGQEFNDNKLGYWGHAANYTPYQIKVPLIVYWPGMTPKTYSYLTSHYDIVPTLMTKLFHCDSPVSDYSLGLGLFNDAERHYIIVSSYIDFAVITKDSIIRVYPTGNIQIENKNGRIINKKVSADLFKSMFRDLHHFYKN